ncbi:hypothetical protein PR048_002919 [Dryococelus australis]|uniref:Uncharacterized protein n=1 Tax=Dryococelus australis TaxID=614101 RepID=A0ABQ9ILI7_9NEOP|nr:hypothetical protein PR048_002919 [Dryococelus australis]
MPTSTSTRDEVLWLREARLDTNCAIFPTVLDRVVMKRGSKSMECFEWQGSEPRISYKKRADTIISFAAHAADPIPSDRRRAATSGRKIRNCEYQAVASAAGRLDYWTRCRGHCFLHGCILVIPDVSSYPSFTLMELLLTISISTEWPEVKLRNFAKFDTLKVDHQLVYIKITSPLLDEQQNTVSGEGHGTTKTKTNGYRRFQRITCPLLQPQRSDHVLYGAWRKCKVECAYHCAVATQCRCETASYNANSSFTRQQNGVTGQQDVRTPIANQHLVTYLPAGVTANRRPFAARSNQSGTRPVLRDSRSQRAGAASQFKEYSFERALFHTTWREHCFALSHGRPESILSDVMMAWSRERVHERALSGPIETRPQIELKSDVVQRTAEADSTWVVGHTYSGTARDRLQVYLHAEGRRLRSIKRHVTWVRFGPIRYHLSTTTTHIIERDPQLDRQTSREVVDPYMYVGLCQGSMGITSLIKNETYLRALRALTAPRKEGGGEEEPTHLWTFGYRTPTLLRSCNNRRVGEMNKCLESTSHPNEFTKYSWLYSSVEETTDANPASSTELRTDNPPGELQSPGPMSHL